jgi:hypothetical protein
VGVTRVKHFKDLQQGTLLSPNFARMIGFVNVRLSKIAIFGRIKFNRSSDNSRSDADSLLKRRLVLRFSQRTFSGRWLGQ